MSDAENVTPGKAAAWTPEAKYEFLLRVVAQFKGRNDGKAIDWKTLEMPGRTTKSMQNIWTKINKSIDELEKDSGAEGGEVKETPKKRGRKPRVKDEDTVPGANDEDELAAPVKKTPKKRGNGDTTPKSNKKVKKDSDSEEVVKDAAESDGGKT